jgi:integral membrane protein
VTRTPGSLYRVMALAEMATWTLLIIAMVARYGFAYDGPLFFVAGLSHGIIFLAYCVTAVIIGINLRWGFGTIVLAILSAIPPWVTWPFDRWLEKRNKLEGEWRLEDSGDPRDQHWVDRFVRLGLRHPVWSFVIIVLGMALAISILLALGSPTEWGGE